MVNTKQSLQKQIQNVMAMDNIPQISYRFWDRTALEMYEVRSVQFSHVQLPNVIRVKSGNSELIKTFADGVLIPSTGLYDSENNELYAGDIVVCNYLSTEYKDRVIFWDNGWRVFGSTAQEFGNNVKSITKIGDKWNDDDLYKMYTDKCNEII